MLDMELHPKKVTFQKWNQGVDFLGYISFPHHTLVRTKTKKRMYRKMKIRANLAQNKLISTESLDQSFQSYLGILMHCHGEGIKKIITKILQNYE